MRLNGTALLGVVIAFLGCRWVGPESLLVVLSMVCLFFALRFRHARVEG